jgi:predicted transcriptional regulator
MKKVIKEYEVYEYDELNDEAKEKVKDKLSDDIIEVRFFGYKDDMFYSVQELYGIDIESMVYDFSYSQGDGVSITCSNLLTSGFIKKMEEELTTLNNGKEALSKAFTFFKNNLSRFTASVKENNGRNAYFHESQVKVFFDDDELEDGFIYEKDDIGRINFLVYKTVKNIINYLYKSGYEYQEVNDEDIQEEARMNELVFLENGSIFNE